MSQYAWDGPDNARAAYRDGRLSLLGQASMIRADDYVALGIDLPSEQRRQLAEALLADCELEPEVIGLLREAREHCGVATGERTDTATKLDKFFERIGSEPVTALASPSLKLSERETAAVVWLLRLINMDGIDDAPEDEVVNSVHDKLVAEGRRLRATANGS